jgi:hypothetical protein
MSASLPAVCRDRRLTRLAGVALAALVLSGALGGPLVSSASAASGVRACYTYRGQGVMNLRTSLERRWPNGTSTYLGAPSRTDRYGCVTYSIHGSWQRFPVRVRAMGFLANTRYVFSGISYLYAPAGGRFYRLGTRYLGLYLLPAQTTPAPSSTASPWDPGDWVSQMSGSPTDATFCNQSPAMQVACYMDRHNMQGNVIYFDGDGDGYPLGQDRDDSNPSYW